MQRGWTSDICDIPDILQSALANLAIACIRSAIMLMDVIGHTQPEPRSGALMALTCGFI